MEKKKQEAIGSTIKKWTTESCIWGVPLINFLEVEGGKFLLIEYKIIAKLLLCKSELNWLMKHTCVKYIMFCLFTYLHPLELFRCPKPIDCYLCNELWLLCHLLLQLEDMPKIQLHVIDTRNQLLQITDFHLFLKRLLLKICYF